MGAPLVPEFSPAMMLYYRSDHFSFVKRGIPGLWVLAGPKDKLLNYIMNDYHKPTDIYHDDWDMDGLLQQVEFVTRISTRVCGDTSLFPELVINARPGVAKVPKVLGADSEAFSVLFSKSFFCAYG